MSNIKPSDVITKSSAEQSTSIGSPGIQSGPRTLPSLMESLTLVDPLSEIIFNRNPFEPSINNRHGRALWNEVHNDFDVLIAQCAYNSAKSTYQHKISEAARKRFDARYRKGATTAPSRALPSRVRQPGPPLPPLRSPTPSSSSSPVLGPVNDIVGSQQSRNPGAAFSLHIPPAMPAEVRPSHAHPTDPSTSARPPFNAPPGMAWKLVPLYRTRPRASPQPPSSQNRDVRNASSSSV